MIRAIEYKDGVLHLIDQRKLPLVSEIFECRTYRDAEFAIKDMVVRGAPAIGISAGYGAALAAREFASSEHFDEEMEHALDVLNASRPTAVNLMWAVAKMRTLLHEHRGKSTAEKVRLVEELAERLYREEEEISRKMAENGAPLIREGMTLLTHCNTGSLATVGLGTALGVIKHAHHSGKKLFVYADETRPRLQGGKLTAYELKDEGIPFRLIADNAAASLIRDGKIDAIFVGADRIASNGDTANKVGTFMLSVLAKEFGVPFYIVAPMSTIDFDIANGGEIEIEERAEEEVTELNGVRIAPQDIRAYNPAFDVTPNHYITAIVTDKKVFYRGTYGFSLTKE